MTTQEDPKQHLFTLYPEAPFCGNCNACTEACPQGLDVREGVWRAVPGDFEAVSDMFMDCVMCGLCTPVCIAHIPPNLVAVYASRAQGVHFTEKPERLGCRIKEIEDGRYDAEWTRVLLMAEQKLEDGCAPLW